MRGRRAVFANGHLAFVGGLGGLQRWRVSSPPVIWTWSNYMKNLFFAAKPLLLDMGSTLLFVIVSALTHNPMLATAVAIAAGVARVAYVRSRKQQVTTIQWLSLG